MAAAPPTITGHAWGRVTVDGRTYKDVMLMPGRARAWDWNRTGTSHGDGVQPADVTVLLDHGARHVVLSQGRHGRLQIHADTLTLLADRGVTYDVLMTDDAVERYEQLRAAGEAVGALLHTTC
ncbi:MAG TPA: MTH938/NDUFAF3 family protein [Euzebyales bacterium]